jgi:hypothetical protein
MCFFFKAHDLKFFMLMLTVFILAFGVPSYSLIYGVQKFSWHIPREIINLAYWQIFGELNALETFERNRKIRKFPSSFIKFFIQIITMLTVTQHSFYLWPICRLLVYS